MFSKDVLRKDLKLVLKSLSKDEWREKSLAVSLNLKFFLNQLSFFDKDEKILGAFAPFQKEPLWNLTFKSGSGYSTLLQNRLAFPSLSGEQMIFLKSTIDDLIGSHEFGPLIMGPNEKEGKKVVTPSVLLIPGLGFGRGGERLGRGKGFYDRYLQTHESCVRVGVCFDEQIISEIPMNEFDREMHFIVTDREVIKI